MNEPIITIRRHTTESGKRGWRWTCRLCRAAGMHHHNRWTDHVLAKYGKADPHPMQRCIAGGESHAYRFHRASLSVNVNIFVGGRP